MHIADCLVKFVLIKMAPLMQTLGKLGKVMIRIFVPLPLMPVIGVVFGHRVQVLECDLNRTPVFRIVPVILSRGWLHCN